MSTAHVVWVLFASVLQAVAITLLVGGGMRIARGATAAARYSVWIVTFAVVTLLPLANLALPSYTVALPIETSWAQRSGGVGSRMTAQTAAYTEQLHRVFTSRVSRPNRISRSATSARSANSAPHISLAVVLILWGSVATLLLLRLTYSYTQLRGIKASLVSTKDLRAQASHLFAGSLRLCEVGFSTTVSEPCAIGFLRPAIALPTSLADAITAADLPMILRHEHAHLLRYDDYTNLVTQIVRALFFFNPALYVIARVMAIEREIACDDMAARDSQERLDFARCLYMLASMSSGAQSISAAGFVGNRRHLSLRVARLLERNRDRTPRPSLAARLAACAVVAGATALAGVRVSTTAATALPATSSVARMLPIKFGTFSGTIALSQCAAADEIQIRLEYRRASLDSIDSGSTSECVPVSTFRDMTIDELTSNVSQRRAFDIVRDAGTMQVQAKVGDGRGSGTWVFIPSPSFAVQLRRRGIQAPSEQQQFELTMADFSIAMLDKLRASGFAPPSVSDIVRIGEVGVTNQLIEAVSKLPPRTKTVGDLIRCQEVGTTATYIAELNQLGYSPSVEALIRLKEVGVTPQWVEQLRKRGKAFQYVNVDDLIMFKERGI